MHARTEKSSGRLELQSTSCRMRRTRGSSWERMCYLMWQKLILPIPSHSSLSLRQLEELSNCSTTIDTRFSRLKHSSDSKRWLIQRLPASRKSSRFSIYPLMITDIPPGSSTLWTTQRAVFLVVGTLDSCHRARTQLQVSSELVGSHLSAHARPSIRFRMKRMRRAIKAA